ncbi:uncharacterized protein LOC114662614 [Erpetoichthys calabaricus]|uniref:uncharacterized protein LOC114662614 n=1 Tax=Erpetoichthys calabaricus TaxID=27687 RepID=UPI00109FA3FC|nr:uncharacterized protein LOC114662614 [Erpetoichthys calabaricus]XP_028672024.1 uncharacterized protein LOC114662614 [Erpetoichthys calabaricus]
MAFHEDLLSIQSETYLAPNLNKGELHHVFISYSSLDTSWANSFIKNLESPEYGFKVCYHERDFVAGKSVMDNMTDCIRASQKVVLILSEDFLRSRWCLLEANLSLFQDCSQGKPVVPILLQPCVIPLHLRHLTYLDVEDPRFYKKLFEILCTPNHLLRNPMGPLCQPVSAYEGKLLATVSAVDEDIPPWASGTFSNLGPPGQLEMVADSYREAIEMINDVAVTTSVLQYKWIRSSLAILFGLLLGCALCLFFLNLMLFKMSFPSHLLLGVLMFPIGIGLLCISAFKVGNWEKQEGKVKLANLRQIAGSANILMSEQNVLLGFESRVRLHSIYMPLESCRETFQDTFPGTLGEEMFHKALLHFSSGYAVCVAKKHFPFPLTALNDSRVHTEVGVCFCQYVSQQLRRDIWT